MLCNYALQGGVGGDVWVYACLPVWLASSGNVVVCALEARGPPDVSECEVGGTFGSSGSGLVLQVCLVRAGSLQARVLSTSISLSFRSRSSAWCPHPVLTSWDRPFGDTKKKKYVNLPGPARVINLLELRPPLCPQGARVCSGHQVAVPIPQTIGRGVLPVGVRKGGQLPEQLQLSRKEFQSPEEQ